MTEIELTTQLNTAIKAAEREFREDKVRQLCWYLLDGRDSAAETVVERAVELATDIRIIERLIGWEGR